MYAIVNIGFLRQRKMCFTEPEWNFLNDKHHQVAVSTDYLKFINL